MESEVKNKEKRLDKAFKRVCESEWHEETLLQPFQECPICFSTTNHKTIVLQSQSPTNASNDNLQEVSE